MTRRGPAKVGLWLLQRLGRGYHSEALIGDLIEQCAQGRTACWAWREIIVAIFIGQAGRWRSSQWPRVTRVFWWCVTEVAVMLSVVSVADQSRNSHTFKGMVTPTFVVTLMVLLSIAFIGLKSLIRLRRRQQQRLAIHPLMALFVVMTLGVGALTWAATVHRDQAASRERSSVDNPTTSGSTR